MKETLKKLMKDYLEANGYDLSEEKWMIWLMNTNQCKHLLNLRTEALKW